MTEDEAAPEKGAKAPKDPTSVVKLEMGKVLGRYRGAPPFAADRAVAPFGAIPAWVPRVWRKQEGKTTFALEAPKTPWRALDRALTLVQDRLRAAGNGAVIAAWVNRAAEKPLFPGTVIYRVLSQSIVGGDVKQGEDVPYVNSDVVAASARRIEKLCARLWKPKVPKMPCLDARWPVFFRPSGWRLLDDRSIAFNLDGTWWHVGLRVPRPRAGRRAGAKHKAAYISAAMRRLRAGEPLRGVSAEKAPVAPDVWIPSTLALAEQGGKWMAILSYRYPRRPAYEAENALIVHCGLRFFAAYQDVAGMLGHGRDEYIHGSGLLARMHQFRRQRQRLMRSARKFATPGRGHKYQARAFALDDTEKHYVDDWLRRRARRVVMVAKQRKARIFIAELRDVRKRAEASDLPRGIKTAVHQAPWFRFRLFIQEAAAKEGVPVESYKPYYHTKRCPNPDCGETSAAACDYKRWYYTCPSCGRTQGLEGVAITNAIWDLVRDGRITLPNQQSYQAFFDKLEDAAQAAERQRQERREESHLTDLGDERFGAAKQRPSKNRGVTNPGSSTVGRRSRGTEIHE